jgi:hypothetical protein
MRRFRVRLRTILVAVAFLGMAMAVFVQTARLRQALVREQLMRALAERHRVLAEQERALAEAQALQARATLEQLHARFFQPQPQPADSSAKP